MNELESWAQRPSGLIPSRDERAHNQAMQAIVFETKEAGFRIDAEAAVSMRLMDRAVDLDAHRRNLAGNDPTLNAILTRIELGFVAKGEQHQRRFGSQF